MEKSERRKQTENGEQKAAKGEGREVMGESHTNAAYNKYEFDTKNAIKMYERSSTKTHRAHTHTHTDSHTHAHTHIYSLTGEAIHAKHQSASERRSEREGRPMRRRRQTAI